jgi:myo-inositol-1-phosphate synthase
MEGIVESATIDLEAIMENWCKSHTNKCTGGEMRGARGEDIELFVRNLVASIGLAREINLVAKKGTTDKKILRLHKGGRDYVKKHQVDVHIYLNDVFIAVIECKAYLDSCYYSRACEDFQLFKKFGYDLKQYVFSLENTIEMEAKLFRDAVTDDVCSGVFYALDGKRSSEKPVYDTQYRKKVNVEKLKEFVSMLYSLGDSVSP